MVVYKDPDQNEHFASLSIPPYLRDWMIMRFADSDGRIDLKQVNHFVKQNIPGKKDWELLKSRMIKEGEQVKFLAKLRVEIDVKTGEGFFSLPDLGFPSRKREAVVGGRVLREHSQELLADSEIWGIIECGWNPFGLSGKEGDGIIQIISYTPFQPYKIDIDYFREVRKEFTIDEWVDLLLLAVDYNPAGFLNIREKLTMLSRLIPFVEKRVNLIELAPKGTGKSYLMSQISKHGWLVSGGSISRARLFYDINKSARGLVSRYDYVAFDEIQTISFPNVDEVKGALKGYLEAGEYRVGDYRGVGDAGLVLMGNIDDAKMNVNTNMFAELPGAFQESALIDRFHGFIKGWNIPRMRENMKAKGWALNVEYFSEVMHALRKEIIYPGIVNAILDIPKSSDTRDTTAIQRICSGFMKLLFPHVLDVGDLNREEFTTFCLEPALEMRATIKRQLHIMDSEYSSEIPNITLG